MSKIITLMATACIALSGCLPSTAPEAASDTGAHRITTAAEFNKVVVGHRLTIDDEYYTIRADGTLDGIFAGKPLAATWEWKDGYFCRQLTTHSKGYDCQLLVAAGNKLTATRNEGKGKTFVLTIH